jgi:hypothetical protein
MKPAVGSGVRSDAQEVVQTRSVILARGMRREERDGMDETRFVRIVRTLGFGRSRRALVRGALAQGGIAFGAAVAGNALLRHEAGAKKLCRKTGSLCKHKGKGCKAKYCGGPSVGLRTPFSIEVGWSDPSIDHDTYLFVPNADGNTDPFPYVNWSCRPGQTECQSAVYPYICVDDAGPVDETVTVRKLLSGVYGYWVEVDPAQQGELTVVLRNADGRVLRTWVAPPNPFSGPEEVAWHVFDLDGSTGHITTVDQVVDIALPGIHPIHTDVCPY